MNLLINCQKDNFLFDSLMKSLSFPMFWFLLALKSNSQIFPFLDKGKTLSGKGSRPRFSSKCLSCWRLGQASSGSTSDPNRGNRNKVFAIRLRSLKRPLFSFPSLAFCASNNYLILDCTFICFDYMILFWKNIRSSIVCPWELYFIFICLLFISAWNGLLF